MCSSQLKEGCQSGRSCGTRNAVSVTGPRVRIPGPPPYKNASIDTMLAFLFCTRSRQKVFVARFSGGFFVFFRL